MTNYRNRLYGRNASLPGSLTAATLAAMALCPAAVHAQNIFYDANATINSTVSGNAVIGQNNAAPSPSQ